MTVIRKSNRARIERALLARVRSRRDSHAENLKTIMQRILESSVVGRGPGGVSRPGDPPARRTGDLIRSIKVLRRFKTFTEVGPDPADFPANRFYPVFLEFGTRKMAPRPYIRPSIRRFKAGVRGRAPTPFQPGF